MGLLLLGTAAYAAYKASHEDELEVTFDDKVPVTLLPLEQTLGIFDTPLSTLTYYEGDYLQASKVLMRRIPLIIEANPWLGGVAARQKGDTEVRLWYDPTGKDVAPGTFYCFQPGEIPLRSGLGYAQLEELGKRLQLERTPKIPSTKALVNKNQALWRVTVCPLADDPYKYVLIVSMSRLLGDPVTFYELYRMLGRDASIQTLHATRRLDISQKLQQAVGREEAFYLQKVTTNPRWEWSKSKRDPTEKLLFLWDNDWLEVKMREAGCNEDNDGVDNTSATRDECVSAVITSWFLNELQPTIGMMSHDFRPLLETSSTHKYAGNYCNTIIYTEDDYATPEQIQRSTKTLRRCAHDPPTPLPTQQWDMNFGVTTNWASLCREKLDLGHSSRETLHLPWFDSSGLSVIPNKLSVLFLFTAKHGDDENERNRQLGALVVAPRSGIAKIVGKGAVGEVIAKF